MAELKRVQKWMLCYRVTVSTHVKYTSFECMLAFERWIISCAKNADFHFLGSAWFLFAEMQMTRWWITFARWKCTGDPLKVSLQSHLNRPSGLQMGRTFPWKVNICYKSMQNYTIKKKIEKKQNKLTPVQIGWNVIRLEFFFFFTSPNSTRLQVSLK